MNLIQRTPATVANDASAGTTAWTNPGQAATSDGTAATVTLAAGVTSQFIKATDFKFDAGPDPIPSDAAIVGVEALVQVYQDPGDSHTNVSISNAQLVIGGAITGNDRANNRAVYRDEAALVDIGNKVAPRFLSLDLWGTHVTAAQVRASGFGVAVQVKNNHGSAAAHFICQIVMLRVYWSKTAEVVLRTNHSTDNGGDTSCPLMAPCLISVDAIQSPVGTSVHTPDKCEFRWTVEGPEGWEPTIRDNRRGIDLSGHGGLVRTERNSKIGFYANWLATLPGTYVVTCALYTPDSVEADAATPVATASVTFTVAEDTRTVKYVNAASGDDGDDGSEGSPWETIGHALATVGANTRIMVAGGDQDLDGVNITNPLTNVVIDAEDPFLFTTSTNGLQFIGAVTGMVITENISFEGDASDEFCTCVAFSGSATIPSIHRSNSLDCIMLAGGFCFLIDDSRHVRVSGLRGGVVGAYGVFSNDAAFVEIIGYDMDAHASGNGNGHIRFGAPVKTTDGEAYRGVGWSLQFCKWDCSGSALAGVRAPGSYLTVNWCESVHTAGTNGAGIGTHNLSGGTSHVFCSYLARGTGNFFEAQAGVNGWNGIHQTLTDSVIKSIGGNFAISNDNDRGEQVYFVNCTFWQDVAPAFGGWVRLNTNTITNVNEKQTFFEGCGFFYNTYSDGAGFPTYILSDRADVNVNAVQVFGYVKNCAFPADTTHERFSWSDGTTAHADTIPTFLTRDFVTDCVQDIDGSPTLIPVSTCFQPDSSLTQWRTANVPQVGSYRDYSGTIRDQQAAVWFVGARSGDTIEFAINGDASGGGGGGGEPSGFVNLTNFGSGMDGSIGRGPGLR